MPATPLFTYDCELSIGVDDNLTYLNAGQTAIVTFLVSNRGDPVTVTSLGFGFPPFGPNATNLAQSESAITPLLPAGWTAVSGKPFTYKPPSTKPTIGTESVTFKFRVDVGPLPGTAQVGITEITTRGTAFREPFAITKMPAGFTLKNLRLSKAKIDPGDTVKLTWTATPGATNTVTYVGGPDKDVVVPSSGTAAWTSPPIQTSMSNAPFTVSGSAQSSGQALVAQVSASVIVDVPEVLKFPQPGGSPFSGPVALTWTTSNADRCKLYADGTLVDDKAPANPPAVGYQVYPTAAKTDYALYACKGPTAMSIAHQVTVSVKAAWTKLAEVPVPVANTLLVAPDGSLVYGLADREISVIDTVYNNVVRRIPAGNYTKATGSAVLTPDGTKLLVASSPQEECGLMTLANGAWQPLFRTHKSPAAFVSTSGFIYAVMNPMQIVVYSPEVPTKPWVDPASLDGTVLATAATANDAAFFALTATSLYRYDFHDRKFVRLEAAVGDAIGLSPTRLTAFVGLGTPASPSIGVVTLPSGKIDKRIPFPAVKRFTGMAVDASGGVYIGALHAGTGGKDVMTLHYLDPLSSNRATVFSVDVTTTTDSCGAVVVSSRTGHVYFHVRGQVVVFRRASFLAKSLAESIEAESAHLPGAPSDHHSHSS